MKIKTLPFRNIISILALLISFLLILIILIDFNVDHSYQKYIFTPDKASDTEVIIILGAFVKDDGTLSDMLKDRTIVGIDLYKRKKAPKILLSGDHGRPSYDEVNNMRLYVEKNNIPKEDIFMDHAGFSTYESMYRAKEIFNIKKATIVTQEYHLLRALYTARGLGIEAYGVSSNLQAYRGMPMYRTRDIIARFKTFLEINVTRPKPTFLGEKIPISGDGRKTHDMVD